MEKTGEKGNVLPSRTTRFFKRKGASASRLRVTWSDNLRCSSGSITTGGNGFNSVCTWKMLVDGKICVSGKDTKLEAALWTTVQQKDAASDVHYSMTRIGYCDGIGAGRHVLEVEVSADASPATSGTPRTGWNRDYDSGTTRPANLLGGRRSGRRRRCCPRQQKTTTRSVKAITLKDGGREEMSHGWCPKPTVKVCQKLQRQDSVVVTQNRASTSCPSFRNLPLARTRYCQQDRVRPFRRTATCPAEDGRSCTNQCPALLARTARHLKLRVQYCGCPVQMLLRTIQFAVPDASGDLSSLNFGACSYRAPLTSHQRHALRSGRSGHQRSSV